MLFPLAVREISVWTFRAVSVPVSGLVMLAVALARGMPLTVPRADWPRLAAATAAYMLVWNSASVTKVAATRQLTRIVPMVMPRSLEQAE